ncbi:hypothetical protein HK105_206053 [Polyrhizophydium stewartii]|uniref:Rab-GAP TBC domain-containing protein n=1 Tax=Polyrhizophydium stewartii TaxID=2732419 RepID=A0ABR4N4K8_9FUNG
MPVAGSAQRTAPSAASLASAASGADGGLRPSADGGASDTSASSAGFPAAAAPLRASMPPPPVARSRPVDDNAERKRYRELEADWLSMLANWGSASTKRRTKIKKICRLGIPDSVRPDAWAALAGVDKLREPGRYEALVGSPEHPAIFEVIERDIHRCYPNHMMFATPGGEGQQNLRRVLRAYALYHPELGYCQGMGMIVGLLLMRMSPEDAFWLLVAILKFYIPGYHSVNLYELRVDASAFELALQKYLKPIARHMAKLDVSPLTYMTQWFLTLYTMALPWKTVLRVWDMFFCDGPKALLRVGMGILSAKKNYLFKHCTTASDAIGYLLEVPHEFDDADALLAICLKIKIKHDDMDKFREKAKRIHASLDESINKPAAQTG